MAQPAPLSKGDYVLGTQDVEVERLGLQHLVWRPRASDAWRRAGFTVGQHLLDVGCGPGYATLDLSAIVGTGGKVTAVDRSSKFLDVLKARLDQQSVHNVETIELDLDQGALPELDADGAWCRWVFAFLTRPRDLLKAIHGALKPGGTLVVHEYFNYSSWSLSPRQPGLAEFVQLVISSWRKSGGEPDIGLELNVVAAAGRIRNQGAPPDRRRDRPARFHLAVAEHVRGCRTGAFDGARVFAASSGPGDPGGMFRRAESDPDTRMITPGVLKIVATRL